MPSVVKTIFAEQLCQAILEKDLWCVQAILRLGADVNHLVEEKGGVSAMHLAAGIPGDSGLEIMKTLLTHGGDPNIKSEEGLTPVHIGVIQGREWIVDLLLRNGGNPWIRDNEECDAFTYAKDQPRVIYLLQQQAQFKLQEEDSWDSLTQLRFSKVLPVKTVQSWHGSTSSLTHASCHILTSQDMTGDSTCTLGSMNVTIVEDESVQCQQDKTDPDMLHGGSCLKAKVDFQTSDGEFNRAFIKPLNNFHSISSSIFPEGEGAFSSSLSSLRSCGSVVELVYTDEEEGVVLLERRWPKDIPSVLSSSRDSYETARSWKDYQETASPDELCDSEDSILSDELRKALVLHGETPGPITSTTKSLYKKRLLRFQQLGNLLKIPSEQAVKESPKPCYSAELSEALEDLSLLDEADLTSCEAEMVSQFQRPVEGVNWREGVVKSAFTYLLLDPRVTCNLPAQTHLSEKEKFRTFVSSVFYIGKGQRSRPYSHLYEALRATENKHKEPVKKVKQIQEIWESGMGVVSLHIFLSVIPAEAYTREAAMIDAIGLKNLTNIRRGDYYGISSTWDPCQRRRVGTFLLLKAMRILLHEGERQLWPANL